ncbi:MAG: TonB-dependent receptor plug domain-containing protein, partial [Arcobacteraceae bacterium]
MKKIFLFIIIFTTILFSNPLNNLLDQYENASEKSLQTVDEKLGHVVVYSQKEIRLMQYKTLNDILKELPLINLNKNRYGFDTPGLSGTKTTVSGFFRFFINDYEVSSVHTQSATLTWGSISLDFIDHVEVYYGDSSFGIGNETGVYFIRMYTKSAKKENATELNTSFSKNENSQSITQSKSFENNWSYLLFANNSNENRSIDYDGKALQNNADKNFLYLDISNDKTDITIGYANVKADTFIGMSSDAKSNDGEIRSEDFFINVNKYFLDDKSLKASVSMDLNYRKYDETNDEGLMIIPLVDFSSYSNISATMPITYKEDILFTKLNAHISKTFTYKNNQFVTAFNVKNKKYEVKKRESINFSNDKESYGLLNPFNEETIYSLLFQNDYQAAEELFFIFNAKAEKYVRSGYLENLNETLF